VVFGGVWWCLVVFGGVWWCLVISRHRFLPVFAPLRPVLDIHLIRRFRMMRWPLPGKISQIGKEKVNFWFSHRQFPERAQNRGSKGAEGSSLCCLQ
jgi:hypothetical protein